MTRIQLGRLPRSPDELWAVVHALWGVVIPRHAVCPDHVAPFTAFSDAYFAVNSLDPTSEITSLALWHGSRGLSGKSYMLSILGLTQAFLLGTDVNLLGGSLAQSANIHEHMRAALHAPNAPRHMLEIEGNTLVKLNNGARIRPLTASQKTVRGPHPSRLLLDEIDEMDLSILNAALGQPMEQPNYLGEIVTPYTVMCSTWQNPEGSMTAMIRRAEEEGIPKYVWCFRETANAIDGWLTQEAIERKKREIPKSMWEAEYELNEPSIGTRAFDTDAVMRAFSLPMEPLEQKTAKDFEEYTFEQPNRRGQYVAAADWGKEKDYTVISVARIDVHPYRLVYFMRVNRRPYPQMIGWFNDAINKYSAEAIHDGTGLGNVVNDYVDLRARSFTMTGEKRDAMLSAYVVGIETDMWRFPKITNAYTAHRYAQYGDLYSRKDVFHLPDEVCSFALLHRLAHKNAPFAPPVVVKKDGQPTSLQDAFDNRTRREGDVYREPRPGIELAL